jgi:hypothetical protein
MAPAELGQDLALALDPVLLMERAGITAVDPWQAQVLRTEARQVILNCSRQSGKSTITAGRALHTALYEPESLILLLSPGERQSKELLRKCFDLYGALDRPIPSDVENKLELELANGSRIVALPGGNEATIRGWSGVRLAIFDESSRVDDVLYYAVRPMLAVSGGQLMLLSTPFGQRGFFHKEWTEGGADWERILIKASQVPRISAKFLTEERARIGDWWYRQEYDCDFVATEDQVFAYDLVMGAVDPAITPLFPIGDTGLWLSSSALT